MLTGEHYKIALDKGYAWMDGHGMGREKEEIKKRLDGDCTYYELQNSSSARPFPGAPELLTRLRRSGYATGVLTRGSRRYAESILGMFGLLAHFDGIVARDDYDEETEAKPAPIALTHLGEAMGGTAPENILYIGDGIIDFMTAARAGSSFMAVTSGNTDAANWRRSVALFLEREPHPGYSAEDLVILSTVADLGRMLRSETVAEAVSVSVGVAESLGLPELHGRIVPENYDIHADDALSAQNLPGPSDQFVGDALAAPSRSDREMVDPGRTPVASDQYETDHLTAVHGREAVGGVPREEESDVGSRIHGGDDHAVLLPESQHTVVIPCCQLTVHRICHVSRMVRNIDNIIPGCTGGPAGLPHVLPGPGPGHAVGGRRR